MKQKSKEGFSLVEMLIALAASSIVMLAIMMIMGFCTSTMRRTQQRVDLQEQAKDAMNHISAIPWKRIVPFGVIQQNSLPL